ncbi:AMP-binding protein [Pseudoxanthomonas daejeonensis]|uniref:Capsule biosynthesis protein CapK n=1 Tax=Pseudoxanthomonas daejeonensis TaxID=266062 RepID=A0ABQ6Z743_9GAMM|nr:AMP-binding protein [Pseudoxanthomonas daejeonensis]KAF1694715.1 capsule biosynthesis protein CapK [Pseudoxanthomonas daejeonensis]
MTAEPSDAERYPTLTDAGAAMLRRMREHPAAPIFRNTSGNRLLGPEVDELSRYERDLADARFEWAPSRQPEWLMASVAKTFAQVPYYRAQAMPESFTDIAPVDRGALAADIARFVPDTVSLDRLINFRTTGTTGHPLVLPSHPVVAARYLAHHKRALNRFGIELSNRGGQMGVMLLGMQRRCFTYVSVTPTMGESGLAKINLHPDDWRDPSDRARYIDQMQPEVIAGDPISFAALLELPVAHRPRALLSVSMALSQGLRRSLAERFDCAVLDLYSMNEAGPLAVYDDAAGGHVLLQPGMYIEILDPNGKTLPPGLTGEITLTGGFNFCLPLLRYRTGDHGALAMHGDCPMIVGLQGRRPVRFLTAAGQWINNIDLTHALAVLPLSRYQIHQATHGDVTLALPQSEIAQANEAETRLQAALGGRPITVVALDTEDKVRQYTSDMPGGDTP